MKQTKIEWVKNRDGSQGDTWNLMWGCAKVSPGCQNCYAERLLNGRLRGDFHRIVLKPGRLIEPLHVRKPTTYFVNSLSDLWLAPLHGERAFLDQALAVMMLTPRHTYIVATKRPQLALDYLTDPGLAERVGVEMAAFLCKGADLGHPLRPHLPLPNLWHLASCEDQLWYDRRVPILMRIPAARRGVSLEPLLGPIWLDHPGLDWVIVGGESGPTTQAIRPMNPDWVRSLRDQCQLIGLPFLFKQWGEWTWPGQVLADGDEVQGDPALPVRFGKKAAGRLLDGRTWDEMPAFSELPAER